MPHYSWKQLYKSAALETDDARLQDRIRETEIALNAMREALTKSAGDGAALTAMEDALRALNVLKRERLGWRRYGT